MIDRQELELRLKGWAQEYGGGKYENVGWQGRNLIQTIVEHKGFMPDSRGYIPVPIRSAADEVERVVSEMEAGDWYRNGRVLRCDYFQPHLPMDVRLQLLRQAGLSMARSTYFELLAKAKEEVASRLKAMSRMNA